MRGVLGSAGGCGVSTVLKLAFTRTQARAVVCTSTCAAGGVRCLEDTGLGLRPSWHMQRSAKWLQGHVCAPHQVLCFCVLQSSLVCFWMKQACPPPPPPTVFTVDPGSFCTYFRKTRAKAWLQATFCLGWEHGLETDVQFGLKSAVMALTPHQGHQRKGIFFVRFQFRCD